MDSPRTGSSVTLVGDEVLIPTKGGEGGVRSEDLTGTRWSRDER